MIEREDRSGIRIFRLAHGKASALDLELLEALAGAIDELASGDARAAVLTGTGSIFSAGVDLFRLLREGPPYVARFYPALCDAFEKLFAVEKPVVAAINGHAIAGGCVIAAACDHRIMAAGKGRMGVPELLVGVPFPPQVMEILRFSYAAPHFQELVSRGITVLPEEALTRGIVHEISSPEALLDRALEVADQLASIPPASFSITKRIMRSDALSRGRAGAAAFDTEAIEIWSRPEIHAAIQAYLDRTVGKKAS